MFVHSCLQQHSTNLNATGLSEADDGQIMFSNGQSLFDMNSLMCVMFGWTLTGD